MRTKAREYARLIRPYGLLFSCFIPVFGALCNSETHFFRLVLLLTIGVLTHVFGFVQNDYFDVDVDRESPYVVKRPLAIGSISKKEAMILSLSPLILSLLVAGVFLYTLFSFSILVVTFGLMTLYNKYSKQLFGVEYLLGAGIFTFTIFGGLTVSDSISILVIIIGGVWMMQWLFSVGVFANLKDVPYDIKRNIRTTPTILGVYVQNDTVYLSNLFKGYAFGLKTLHIIIAGLPFLIGYSSIYVYSLPIPLICFIFLAFILLYLVSKILSTPFNQRDRLLIYEGLQEGLAFLLVPIVLISYLIELIGIIQSILLIVLFITWPLVSLRILYGKNMIPLE